MAFERRPTENRRRGRTEIDKRNVQKSNQLIEWTPMKGRLFEAIRGDSRVSKNLAKSIPE